MQEAGTTPEDSSVAIAKLKYGGISNVPWYAVHLDVLSDYRLAVGFVDGTTGVVEMRDLIFSSCAGVFAALRDERIFSDVSLIHGDVIWANGLDIAPDAMYDEFREHGVWCLRGDA
jgi:hypothetical protein